MSPIWTKILDSYTIHQHQMKWVILGVCCLSVLGGAGIVTWYYVANHTAPDAQTAEIDKIADYIKSDRFLEQSSVERGAYVETFMKRYKDMSHDEQKQAREQMGKVLRNNRKLEKTVALSFASKQADAYHKLKTHEQKDQFIDRWFVMMEMAHGGHERAKREYRKRNPVGQRTRPTPEQRKKSVARMRNSLPLIMSKTTADDRSRLSIMVRDAAQRMQQRYGR